MVGLFSTASSFVSRFFFTQSLIRTFQGLLTAMQPTILIPEPNIEDSCLSEDPPKGHDSPKSHDSHVVAVGQSYQSRIRKYRRMARLVALVLISAIMCALWLLLSHGSMKLNVEKPYNKHQLQVQVKGCTVRMVEGPAHTLRLRGLVRAVTFRFENSAEDAETAKYVQVLTSARCSEAWRADCATLCELTIHAPKADPPAVHVWQDAGDVDPAVDVRATDVQLKDFKLAGVGGYRWTTAGPTLQLLAERVVFQKDVLLSLDGGMVRCQSCTFEGAVWIKSAQNSVYLERIRHDGPVKINWRQPVSRVCVSSTMNHTIEPDPDGVWANCGGDYHRQLAYGYWDTNKDRYIDQTEMLSELPNVPYCCGSRCPWFSYCDPVAWRVFPRDPGGGHGGAFGREGILPNRDWYDNVRALNYTAFVPYCLRTMVLQAPPDAPAAAPWLTLGTVISEGGEIRISFERSAETRARPLMCQGTADPSFTFTAHEPEDRLTGIRMLYRDARRMVQDLAQVYGFLGSEQDVFAVIDVPSAPGVPATKWVYTTRPVFLFLEPAMLQFLSMGLLNPPLLHLLVPHVGAGCGHSDTLTNASGRYCGHEERLAAIHDQIVQGLRTDGVSNHIRGYVLLVGDKGRLWWFPRPHALAEATMAAFDYPLKEGMLAAVIMSLVLGVVFGLACIVSAFTFLKVLMHDKWRMQQARRKILERKMQMGGERPVQASDDDEEPAWNPFETPLALITAFTVTPLRRHWVDSVPKFLRNYCKYEGDPKAPKEGTKYIYMAQLMQRYEMFCLELDLTVATRTDMHRALVKHYDMRPHFRQVQRMHGVQWTVDPADLMDHPVGKLRVCDVRDGHSSSEDGARSPEKVLQEFLAQNVRRSSSRAHYIDMQTRLGPKGDVKVGFQQALTGWCAKHGHAVPPHEDEQVKAILKDRFFLPKRVCQLRGLQWLEQSEAPKLSLNFFRLEALTVLVHLLVMMVPTLVMLVYSMFMQNTWAQTTAQQKPLQWADFFDWTSEKAGLQTYLPFTVIWIENVAYLGLAYVRILLHYLDLPDGCFRKTYVKIFGVLNLLHTFLLFVWIGVVASWLVLAGILYPTKFLPYCAAVVVVVAVVSFTWRHMLDVATALKDKVMDILDLKLQRDLRAAKSVLEGEMLLKQRMRGVVEVQGIPIAAKGDDSDEVTPLDLFNLLDEQETGVLSREDISKLFDRIEGLNMTSKQLDQLFAYCDTDGSGTLTAREFHEGWEFAVRQILEQAAESVGLSSTQIILAIVIMLLWLSLLFAFLFLASQGWYNDKTFDSVVQTLLVAGSGKAVTLMRRRSAAEGGDLDKLAGGVVAPDKGDNDGDEGEGE